MYAKQLLPDALNRLALAQSGVFTREQAALAGLGSSALRRLTQDRSLTRLASHTYLWGLPPLSISGRLWAAHLAAGHDSALGGRAALHLAGAGSLPERFELVVWVPQGRHRRGMPDAVVRCDNAQRLNRRRGALARIGVDDALIDMSESDGLEEFVAATTEALRQGLTAPKRLQAALDRRTRLRHRQLLGSVVQDLTGIESNLEYVYKRDVERAHGLPEGRRQASVSSGTRSDVWYDEFGVLVELDGRLAHPVGRFKDFRRDNRHVLLAQASLRYGGFDLRTSPCEVAQQVAALLMSRGWTDSATPCRRCSPMMRALLVG